MQHHNIHIIEANDTLKSISMLYHLPEEEIKSFHNNNCSPNNHILIDITHQKELILPRHAVIDKSRLVKFSDANTLKFNPENYFAKYAVAIKIENGEKLNEIKYDTSVNWLKTENNLHYFEVDRLSKVFINDEEVNEIADLLAYKASKVLYPLTISVDFNGKFNIIENLEVFKKRWNITKEEIYKDFEGEIVDEYLEKIEKIINEPEIISSLIKNDYFLRTLFFGVYQKYGDKYCIIGEEGFPIVKNAIEPNYQIKIEIDPLKDDYGLINIEGLGRLKDEREKDDFINENPFKLIIDDIPEYNEEGEFRLQFYLNGDTALPEALYLECSISLEEKKKVSVSIADLEK